METLKDGEGKDVAKIKVKSSGEIEYTTLSNLSEVEEMSKELKYKMIKGYTAVELPYSSNQTDKAYSKNSEFTGHKRYGNFIKVKGNEDIEGYWISKNAAIATEPEFPVTTEQLKEIFSNTSEERVKEVVLG